MMRELTTKYLLARLYLEQRIPQVSLLARLLELAASMNSLIRSAGKYRFLSLVPDAYRNEKAFECRNLEVGEAINYFIGASQIFRQENAVASSSDIMCICASE